jgi:hypothetical protein
MIGRPFYRRDDFLLAASWISAGCLIRLGSELWCKRQQQHLAIECRSSDFEFRSLSLMESMHFETVVWQALSLPQVASGHVWEMSIKNVLLFSYCHHKCWSESILKAQKIENL